MISDVHCHTLDETRTFAREMAEALATGREFAVYTESDAEEELLAYTIRLQCGAYRLRDRDLNDAGAFAKIGAAMREAGRMVDGGI